MRVPGFLTTLLCQFWEGEVGDAIGDEQECEVPTDYIGKVNYFVKVVPAEGVDSSEGADEPAPKAEVLRLAVMDLHLLQCIDAGVGDAYQSVTYAAGRAAYSNTALSLSWDDNSWATLCCKMALAVADGVAFFLPYSNMFASGVDD